MRGMFFVGALVVIEYHKELLLKPYGVREMHVRCLFFMSVFFLVVALFKELLMLMQYGMSGCVAAGIFFFCSAAAGRFSQRVALLQLHTKHLLLFCFFVQKATLITFASSFYILLYILLHFVTSLY